MLYNKKYIEMEEKSANFLFLGDSGVGKTCMLISYGTDCFSYDYYPTAFEYYVSEVKIGEETVKLNMWDTSAQESSASLRKCCYGNCDIFFVCFSVIDPSSLENAKNFWVNDIRSYSLSCAEKPIFLVGTKADLRNDKDYQRSMESRGGFVQEKDAEKIVSEKQSTIKRLV